jgi:hypothetical protein
MGLMKLRATCPNCFGKIPTQKKGIGHLTWMANGPMMVKTPMMCPSCGIALTGKVTSWNEAIAAEDVSVAQPSKWDEPHKLTSFERNVADKLMRVCESSTGDWLRLPAWEN